MNKRLKYCVNNVLESLDDLESCIEQYNHITDNKTRGLLINSMRMSIVQIQEEFKRIVQILFRLKCKAVKPDSSIIDSIKYCMKEGFIPQCDIGIFILLRDYRNYSCHRYKRPSDGDIISFCKNINKLREVTLGITDGGIKPSNSFSRD